MSRPPELKEPELSPAAQRVVAALSISIAVHLALIGLLRVTPVASSVPFAPVLQARLEPLAPPTVQIPVPSLKPILRQTPQESAPPAPVAVVAQAPVPVPVPATSLLPSPPVTATPPTPGVVSALPSVKVPLLVDPTFYTAKEVDVHPRALSEIVPLYPAQATRNGQTGSVTLSLKLDETGAVQDVSVTDATPPGVFDQSALDAFHNAHFAPAYKAGRAVKSLVVIKVKYALD